jgi:hypothetical protein
MNQDQIDALVALIQSTGFVNVSCHREFDPPTVQILIPLGLGLTLPYDTYQQIREAAGLPDHVCD